MVILLPGTQYHFREISQFLAEQLLTLNESEREKWLATIINHIQNQSLTTSVIEKPNIELAIRVTSIQPRNIVGRFKLSFRFRNVQILA